jgi:hypothetical protein
MGTHREEKIQPRGTITFTPVNLRDMEDCIKNKEFKTVTELVNFAIHFYFENRDKTTMKQDFDNWIVSEKGSEYLSKIVDTRNKPIIEELDELRSLIRNIERFSKLQKEK